MSEQQMANYTLTVVADSGYESTTEGRCTADQYGDAIAALHGTPPQRQPLTDEQHSAMWDAIRELGYTTKDQTSEILEIVSECLTAHGIKE